MAAISSGPNEPLAINRYIAIGDAPLLPNPRYTGSAIVGPARADIYFGAGDQAGHLAARFHNPGNFAMLVPRELDPVATGTQMPLREKGRRVPP
jgi:hypothetical protein